MILFKVGIISKIFSLSEEDNSFNMKNNKINLNVKIFFLIFNQFYAETELSASKVSIFPDNKFLKVLFPFSTILLI